MISDELRKELEEIRKLAKLNSIEEVIEGLIYCWESEGGPPLLPKHVKGYYQQGGEQLKIKINEPAELIIEQDGKYLKVWLNTPSGCKLRFQGDLAKIVYSSTDEMIDIRA